LQQLPVPVPHRLLIVTSSGNRTQSTWQVVQNYRHNRVIKLRYKPLQKVLAYYICDRRLSHNQKQSFIRFDLIEMTSSRVAVDNIWDRHRHTLYDSACLHAC